MLRDLEPLAKRIKNHFESIDSWPDIEVKGQIKRDLEQLEYFDEIQSYSMRVSTPTNHITLPSQYLLYAILVKELAMELKQYTDVIVKLKEEGKRTSEIISLIRSDSIPGLGMDAYSESIALRPFRDKVARCGAKDFVNGDTLRSIEDFFGSVILKVINVPDASSAALGDFVYALVNHPSLYASLEKNIRSKFEHILTSKKIRDFVRSTLLFLRQNGEQAKLMSCTQLSGDGMSASLESGATRLTSVFKVSEDILSESDLISGNIPRWYFEPIFFHQGKFFYLSTQWTGDGSASLDLGSFKTFVENEFADFKVSVDNGNYFLKTMGLGRVATTLPSRRGMMVDDLRRFLSSEAGRSRFEASLCNQGGYITFSNSGQRGGIKSFSIGLDSLITVLENIRDNIDQFRGHGAYVEQDWRDLGSTYFSDSVANAFSTVQTKPLFSTLSKLIKWSNSPELDHINTDQNIELGVEYLEKTLEKLRNASSEFTPEARAFVPAVEPSTGLSVDAFYEAATSVMLKLPKDSTTAFISSLCTKPFVILTGLAGSGKTKLAQAFASWIVVNEEEQVCMVPVGADWTNREPLLGYPNALESGKYVKPDNGVVDLLIRASGDEHSPYFLILDEMNLSHVERYFADFLSTMESGKAIPLHAGPNDWSDVPHSIKLPQNLFVIGTVNVDETTYMFSPKVLDRANVIDFRVATPDMEEFLQNPAKPDLSALEGAGAGMAADFVRIAKGVTPDSPQKDEINTILMSFFGELKKTGAEFGYRTASEIHRLAGMLNYLTKADDAEWDTDAVIDTAVIQKLLPKVHGSRSKLETVLSDLAQLCLVDGVADVAALLKSFEDVPENIRSSDQVRFRQSLEKILRMRTRVIKDGFTSFAEA